MSINEQALEQAAKAAFEHWDDGDDLSFDITWKEVHGPVRECWVNSTRAAVTAYLAALPNDEAAFTKRLQDEISALEMLVTGLRSLNACYRIGTQNGADKALNRIHRAQDKLEQLRQAKGGAG